MTASVKILECTLRDGSYHVDFKFTSRDTLFLATALEAAGLEYIEVGHGLGLNAQNVGKGRAAVEDFEYLRAMSGALSSAKWGMFFIPGIGREDDLRMAADHGMNFVRIGTNVTEVEQGEKSIALAKSLGLQVFSNLMKSYAMSPESVAKQSATVESFGADAVYLVDSAGTMLPEDTARYIDAMREAISLPIGLHCHDNLGLGIANVLTAIQHGAVYVDSTLQGMGRGGGNPSTEVLVGLLYKKGTADGIDFKLIQNLGEDIIMPMLGGGGRNSLDVTAGMCGFHSGNLQPVLEYAREHDLDPRDIMLEVSKINQVSVSRDGLQKAHKALRNSANRSIKPEFKALPILPKSQKRAGDDFAHTVRELAWQVQTGAKKRGKASVLNIVSALDASASFSGFVQEEFTFIIGGIEIISMDQFRAALAVADGLVDYILVDLSPRLNKSDSFEQVARETLQHSSLLTYLDDKVWVNAVALQLDAYFKGVASHRILLLRPDRLGTALQSRLTEMRAEVTVLDAVPDDGAFEAYDVLIFFDDSLTSSTNVKPGGVLFDFHIGNLSEEIAEEALKRNVTLLRPDMRAALASEISALLGTRELVESIMGRGVLGSTPVVAGGIIGRQGDVVLDSYSYPTRVVGVADGKGLLLSSLSPKHITAIQEAEKEIFTKLVKGGNRFQ